jgi:hypothetical protein
LKARLFVADALDSLSQMVRDAQAAKAWVVQANALKASKADGVVFVCANPPYSALFSVSLPRELWEPALDQAIADAQAKIDAVTAVAGVASAAPAA